MIPLLEDLSVVYLHLVLPDDFSVLLPDVRHTWTHFLNLDGVAKRHPDDPLHQFETFLETLEERRKPNLSFVHLQIPHLPWIYSLQGNATPGAMTRPCSSRTKSGSRTKLWSPLLSSAIFCSWAWPTDGMSAMGTENRSHSEKSPSGGERATPPFTNFTLFHPTTACLEGAALAVIQEGAWVYLDGVKEEAGKVLFFGWATDIKTHRAADAITVFVDGELVYKGATGHPREDVAEHFGLAGMKDSGFLFEIDRELLQSDSEVRCFALFRDRASEAHYPADFRWLPKSKRYILGDCPPAQGETCSVDKETSPSYLITRSCSPDTLLAGKPSSEFVTRRLGCG